MKRIFTLGLCYLLAVFTLSAQQLLLSEDFNNCAVPDGWAVEAIGNPDAIWYVGTPENDNSDGSTIDGSCMLIFDDDATGENTPEWTASLQSPAFDGSIWTTIRLSMDVHFRNYSGAASLQILAFDGNEYQEVATYQDATSQTGTQFSEYVTLTADLSFYANPNMSLRIVYDDGGDWAWWAGVDNIEIVGEGSALPVLLETFNDCAAPVGWSTLVESGEYDWQFGTVSNPNAEGEASTMNGSCFAFFDDDVLTNEAVPSRVTMFSPEIDGTQFAHFYLDFDVILRRYEALENLSVGVYDVNTGQIAWAVTYLTDLGGPQFYDYVHETIDLTNYRKPAMKIVFQYSDGGGWGWWVGLDNIKVSAEGEINDLCEQAIPIYLEEECIAGDNTYALFSGMPSICSQGDIGSLWYRYESETNGLVRIQTNATYNDAITIFEGDCESMVLLDCTNYDEFGFTGEQLIFEATAGSIYQIRVSGVRGAFGLPNGSHCITLESIDEYPSPPTNDDCLNSIALTIDENCLVANNYNATFSGQMPSLNDKSKADVWFSFNSGQQSELEILTHADFADVVTLYKGECDMLEEVACSDKGHRLNVSELENETTYYLQVSGYFATLNGTMCVEVKTIETETPENGACVEAIAVEVGGDCVTGINNGAEFSGPTSSCDIYLNASIWYSFIAPASGKLLVEVNADFVHGLSILEGNCGNLEEVYCAANPNDCNGNAVVEGLQPGGEYYIRISSAADLTGIWEAGNVCLAISEPDVIEEYIPLTLSSGLECYDNGSAKLAYYVSGGSGVYEIQGNSYGEILEAGAEYLVLVTDENGCTTSISGTVDCPVICSIDPEVLVYGENECPEDYQAAIEVNVNGGTPPYIYEWSNGSTQPLLDGVASGYYTVSVTDADGNCTAVSGALVSGPLPYQFEILSITSASSGLADGAIAIDFAGGAPPYSFSWLLDGNEVSTEQNPVGLYAGTYVLQVIDANGCTFESEDIELDALSQIDEIEDWLYVQLFPNPAHQFVNISWQSSSVEIQNLEVLSISGQRIIEQVVDDQKDNTTLDTSNLPSGMYIVRLNTGRGQLTQKLIIGH